MSTGKPKGGKKNRKWGRNKDRCASYRTSQTGEFNQARRLIRVVRKHPQDTDAFTALEKLGKVLFAAQKSRLGYTAAVDAAAEARTTGETHAV